MIRRFEPLAGAFMILAVLPLIIVVLAAQAFTRTKPTFVVREVWQEGASFQRLEFSRPPGPFGLFLRSHAVLQLPSLLWVVTGKVRLTDLIKWDHRI